MSIKKSIYTFLCLLFSSGLFAEIQFYETTLTSGTFVKVTPLSFVSWGYLDIDYLRLNRIDAGDSGMIKFSIDPTNHVEVSLTRENNLNARFGFIFKTNNHFIIQVDGVEEDLGNIGYTSLDEFRVVKCGEFIRYYKNEDLLFQHCFDGAAGILVHTTHVITATNTQMNLEFDTNLANCEDPFFAPPAEETSAARMAQDNVSDSGRRLPNNLKKPGKTFPKNKLIIASVFNQAGVPVRQFRLRTTKEGLIPKKHMLNKYMTKAYQIEFKTHDKQEAQQSK